MSKKRKTRKSKELKFKIALEAIKGSKTLSQIGKEYDVHPDQITQWKNDLIENGADLFDSNPTKSPDSESKEIESLYKTIGKQTIEIDFLKKNLGMSPDWKE